jgi:hypothetical protein
MSHGPATAGNARGSKEYPALAGRRWADDIDGEPFDIDALCSVMHVALAHNPQAPLICGGVCRGRPALKGVLYPPASLPPTSRMTVSCVPGASVRPPLPPNPSVSGSTAAETVSQPPIPGAHIRLSSPQAQSCAGVSKVVNVWDVRAPCAGPVRIPPSQQSHCLRSTHMRRHTPPPPSFCPSLVRMSVTTDSGRAGGNQEYA